MERTYFALWYRLDSRDRYLIWFTSERDNSDGVVTSSDFMSIFNSKAELEKYAQINGFMPVDVSEPLLHNLDMIAKWLKMKKMKHARQVDCVHLLNAWNLFADVSKSVNGGFDSNQERTQKIYSKLFWGNNLPTVTPEGRFYVPLWSGRELEIIHEVLKQGLLMFRNHAKRP
jgi:hypothetical protein